MALEDRDKFWPDTVDFYRKLIEDHGWRFQPMLNLVAKVTNSPYALGTAHMTSHATLYIAQSNAGLNLYPRLRIEYDPDKDHFAFTYEDCGNKKKWWRRTARSDEGFEVLERFFLKRARWFKKADYIHGHNPDNSQ